MRSGNLCWVATPSQIASDGVINTGPSYSGPKTEQKTEHLILPPPPRDGRGLFLIRYVTSLYVIDFVSGCEICADNII